MWETGTESERSADGRGAVALGWILACLIVGGVVALDPWGFAPFGPAKVTVVAVATLAAGAALAGRTVTLPRGPLVLWAGLLLWTLIATVVAIDPLHAWIGTPDRRLGWVSWALFALAFVCGQALSEYQARLVVRAAAVAACAMGVYALAELAGMASATVEFADGRLGGPFGQPAYLGAAGALLMPLAAGLAADRGEQAGWRLVAAGGAVLAGFAVLGSQTRGAWAGLAVGVVVLIVARRASAPAWMWRITRRRPLWTLVVVACTVVLMLVTPVGQRAASVLETGDAAQARLDEWRVAFGSLASRPLLGAGPEGYRIAFTGLVDAEYARAYGRGVLTDRAHNGPLDVGVSAGAPAMAGYLLLMALVLVAAWRSLSGSAPWLAGVGVGVIAYAVQQQFLFPLVEVDPAFWLFAGLVVRSRGAPQDKTVRVPRGIAPVLAFLAAGALAAGALEITADRALEQANTRGRGHDAAVAAADRATGLRPDSIRVWFVAARVAGRGPALTDVDAALDRIEAGLARSPHDPALGTERAALLLERAWRSRLPGDAQAATSAAARLVAGDAAHPGHHLRLASALALSGDLRGACAALEHAQVLDPSSRLPPQLREELHEQC